jgi:hypothetical protein
MNNITNLINRINKLSLKSSFILYIIIDVVCTGMGMGVPVFNIALGFPAGWFIIRKFSADLKGMNYILQKLLAGAFLTSCVTLVGMILIWGWSIGILFGSDAEIVNFGLPMIMYTPRASLIGWLILMIVISPFLQLLTTLFAGNLTLVIINKKNQ